MGEPEITITKSDLPDIIREEKELIFRLAATIEYRQMENNSHLIRIAKYVRHIASNLELSVTQQDYLEKAAPLHDIGIIGIPDRILRRTGPLNNEEYIMLKKHTKIGYRILYQSETKLLQTAAEIALTHHERFNGTGYPLGLKGESIPLSGRIIALADVFDALNSKKSYRKAWHLDDTLNFIQEKAGQYFDPACVAAFFKDWEQVLQIKALADSSDKINTDLE